MRIAYLECFSGISGDMFLGALLDAGVSPALLENAVAAMDLGARLEISRVVRSGISATKVDVLVGGEKDLPREEYWEREESVHSHQHVADRSHEDLHHLHPEHEHQGHSHSHDGENSRAGTPTPHEHSHSHEYSHGRGLTEIRRII